jgi:class I fructose-bisphosphate aldolase
MPAESMEFSTGKKRDYTDLAGCDPKGGGESKGASDLADAVKTAVINKRAGGMGLISGRKAFQRPMKEGAALLQAIQDVYLDKGVTVA